MNKPHMFGNKIFRFFKSLFITCLLAICILTTLYLISMVVFRFKPYKVATGSMQPNINANDIVLVKPKKEYAVGDVIKFDNGAISITHRIKEIKRVDGELIYVCHGDANPDEMLEEVSPEKVEGKVVLTLPRFGVYTDYIGQHKFAIIGLVIIFYCCIGTYENQAELKNLIKI